MKTSTIYHQTFFSTTSREIEPRELVDFIYLRVANVTAERIIIIIV